MDETQTGELLRDVARLYVRLQRDVLGCCGTTSTQCQIFTTLGRGGPMTLAELGRALEVDKGWVSRAVDALATDGSLTKTPSGVDRRTVVVDLSAAGRVRLADLDAALDGLSARVILRIRDEQRPGVRAALEALRDALVAEDRQAAMTAADPVAGRVAAEDAEGSSRDAGAVAGATGAHAPSGGRS